MAGVLAVLLAWPLWSPPIARHGEAREGLVVQDVVRHDRWVLPLRNGELPSKPPLFHWIGAGVASIIGLSDAAVRAPSALAAIAMTVTTYALGVTAGGRVVGWLAAGILVGTHDFADLASVARVDMVFAACVVLGLVAFLRWYQSGSALARAGCYAAAAAAVLAKGPAGAVLPGLVLLAFLVRERALGRLRELWSWPLVGAVLVIDLGWYLAAYAEGGAAFLDKQLMQENVDRFVGAGVFGQTGGGREPLQLVGELATDMLPWVLVLPWAAWRRWQGEREDETGRFLHTWWIVILAFFSIAFGKRSAYLLPLCPAIAVLAARALARACEGAGPAWLPIPARVRRLAPERPALALVAVVIVTIDLVLLLVIQVARHYDDRRDSLVPFADAVGAVVPAHALLVAAPTLAPTDLQVLAYRLVRDIPRAPDGVEQATCDSPRYVLQPVDGGGTGQPTGQALVTSERRRDNVALIGPPSRCGP
jgi:4-amino-4-deoxy-L-arabinose transferase-like glycosyltransferase